MRPEPADGPGGSPSALAPRLQVLGAAFFFSTGGAAIKACSLGAWPIAGVRSALAALFLTLVVPSWRRFWDRRCLLVGLGYAATLVLFVLANKRTMAANATFLQSTAPLWVLLLAPRLLGERVTGRDLLFALPLALGVGLFFAGAERPLATAPEPFTGNLLGLLAGLCWALTLIGLRWLATADLADPAAHTERSGAAVIAGNWIAAGLCLPIVAGESPTVIEAADLALLAYLGLVQTGAAYLLLVRGTHRLPALEVSLLILLEPVLNAVWAALIHGEVPGRFALLGCLLILSGTLARVVDARAGPT